MKSKCCRVLVKNNMTLTFIDSVTILLPKADFTNIVSIYIFNKLSGFTA